MSITLIGLFALLGALQGGILALVLRCSPYFSTKANRYLAITFLTVGIMGVCIFLQTSGTESPWLVIVNDIMWEYLFPVTLLSYFIALLRPGLLNRPAIKLLYLPFWITLVVNLILDGSMELGWYDIGLLESDPGVQLYYQLEDAGTVLLALFTMVFSYRIVRGARATPEGDWGREFWYWSSALMGYWVIVWLLDQIFQLDVLEWAWILISMLFYWVSYRGVLQFQLAEERLDLRNLLKDRPVDPAKSDLPQAEPRRNEYLLALDRLMREEHLYRDSELSREATAEKLGISNSYLSRLMAEQLQTGFTDYVNGFRVEEVKRLLATEEFARYSLMAIGYEAGFNSKSAFYATFKKLTGESPGSYKKALSSA